MRPAAQPPPKRSSWKRVVLRWNSDYRQLQRILSSKALSPALAKFLQFVVVETLEGRGEQLTEYVIAERVFNQRDFMPSEKSVVRVEKRRLREKLKEYYEGPGKDDPVVISLGSTFVPVFSLRENEVPQAARRSNFPWGRVALATGATLLIAVAAAFLWMRRAPVDDFVFTQLTYDSGFTSDPAISPDGKLVAYASDRSGEGNLDIWVQNIATGDRARLAPNPADDTEPSFSPDGSKVVFHSDRDGGGIYTVAVLGGDLKLIAKEGRGPRFSPDGQRIVYWVGESYFVRTQLYMVSSAGGTPRQVQASFYGAHDAVWSPDGKHLLFWGQRDESSAPDWWLAPADGGEATPAGAFTVFAKQGLSAGGPAAWVGGQVFFSARRDTTNLWKAGISTRSGKLGGSLSRLTMGTDQESEPSVASSGNMVFSSVASSTNVWRLPVDLNQGKATGGVQRVTRDLSTEVFPSISANRRLAFSADRSGKREIWVKDLAESKENMLAVSPSEFDSPKITRDGSKLAYAAEHPEWTIHVVAISGSEEKVYKNGGPPRDFSGDGTKLLYEAKSCSPYCVGLLDLSTGQTRELIRDSKLALYPESFSPDGEWIAFQARPLHNDAARTIYVTPFRDGNVGAEDTWIPVTDGTHMDREVKWSPDGGMLYFLSERDGFRCIWAQRLDRRTKHTIGAPFPVYHFHHSQQSLASLGSPGKVGLSVTRDGLVFSLAETTGNIWMAKGRR